MFAPAWVDGHWVGHGLGNEVLFTPRTRDKEIDDVYCKTKGTTYYGDAKPKLQMHEMSDRSISGTPYHSTHVLEAQPLVARTPFAMSFFGRLPIEIREEVYTLVLTFSRRREFLRGPRPIPEYVIDHNALVHHGFDRYYWPTDSDLPRPESALIAKFPPTRGSQRRQSRLAFLVVCRQIYNEARLVYYSVNHFNFTRAPDLLYFLQHISPERRRALASVQTSTFMTVTPDDPYNPGDLKHALEYLLECPNLKELRLEVYCPCDEDCLDLLRKMRGLKVLDVRMWIDEESGWRHSIQRMIRKRRELNALVLRPKD